MRSSSSFNPYREQVDCLTNWFKSWSLCEQTVALYSLLKRITDTQARFLCQVLEEKLKSCQELEQLEDEANDPEYITSLAHEGMPQIYRSLILHLPLLRVGNVVAKTEYWKLLPHVLSGECNMDEGRELLSYTLIHPAVTGEERLWLARLQEDFLRKTPPPKYPSKYNCVSPATDGQPRDDQISRLGSLNIKPDSCSAWRNGGGHLSNHGHVDQTHPPITHLPPSSSTPLPLQHSSYSRISSSSRNRISDHVTCTVTNDSGSATMKCNQQSSNGAADMASSSFRHLIVHGTFSAPPDVQLTSPNANNDCVTAPSGHQQLRRTYSVIPPGYNFIPPCPPPPEHAILSPQNSAASSSSGSDTHISELSQRNCSDAHSSEVSQRHSCDAHISELSQRNSFLERGSGMRGSTP